MKNIIKKILYYMKEFILIIWQLPQEIVGFLIWLILNENKKPVKTSIGPCKFYFLHRAKWWGVSLAHFIMLSYDETQWTLKHEIGHQKQSRILGPLYLLLIGLPSISFNILDRIAHKNWKSYERINWYYNKLPWERWANELMGIGYDVNQRRHI